MHMQDQKPRCELNCVIKSFGSAVLSNKKKLFIYYSGENITGTETSANQSNKTRKKKKEGIKALALRDDSVSSAAVRVTE